MESSSLRILVPLYILVSFISSTLHRIWARSQWPHYCFPNTHLLWRFLSPMTPISCGTCVFLIKRRPMPSYLPNITSVLTDTSITQEHHLSPASIWQCTIAPYPTSQHRAISFPFVPNSSSPCFPQSVEVFLVPHISQLIHPLPLVQTYSESPRYSR